MEVRRPPHLPGDPQRGPRGRGGRRREPAQALEKGLQRRRFGPPVRLEVEETIDDHVLDLLVRRARHRAAPRWSGCPGPLDLRGLHDIADLDRAELKYPAFVPSTHTHLSGVESASPGRRLLDGPRARRAAAPPLRLVLHLGPAVHRAGRRGPAGAGDQADPLPHLRRLPHRRGAHRRRRGGQAGARRRGDQGALRRAREHQVGAQAGGGRLPRGLRTGRAEDPLQAGTRGARRAGGHPPLRATSAPATTTRRPRGSTRTSG